MGIQVYCPNGHGLNVKNGYAGQTGFCPYCRARVTVPLPKPITDEEVLEILLVAGPQKPRQLSAAEDIHEDAARGISSEESGISLLGSPTPLHRKTCPQCHNVVSLAFRICPRCGTPLWECVVSPPGAACR